MAGLSQPLEGTLEVKQSIRTRLDQTHLSTSTCSRWGNTAQVSSMSETQFSHMDNGGNHKLRRHWVILTQINT